MQLARSKYSQFRSLDYWIFSAHKTATQTIKLTLENSDYEVIHCHHLKHLGLPEGSLQKVAADYHKSNKRQLRLISVFREPIERHISSFFQRYGSRAINRKDVATFQETIIHSRPIPVLQAQLQDEIQSGSLRGMKESIDELCAELNIHISDLNYDESRGYGVYESSKIQLYLFRFDTLIDDVERQLSHIAGRPLEQVNSNISQNKWYLDIYREFKATFKLPDALIEEIYSNRQQLIELFYPGKHDLFLEKALNTYGESTHMRS